LAIAGPIEGSEAWLTNGAWHIHAAERVAALGLDDLRLVNDLKATA